MSGPRALAHEIVDFIPRLDRRGVLTMLTFMGAHFDRQMALADRIACDIRRAIKLTESGDAAAASKFLSAIQIIDSDRERFEVATILEILTPRQVH